MRDAQGTALLTGATGLLGSAIAVELLTCSDGPRPLFLVRAENERSAVERLRRSLCKFRPPAAVLDRVDERMVICGDLEHFTTLVDDPRVQSITRVLDCAALASFAWKREVWDVNVEHTSRFARAIATLPAVRRFLYVGTAMISGKASHCVVHEDEVPDARPQLVPYTRSKSEIERRLPALLGRVPLVVARPSIVVGHTVAGCRPSPSIFWIFRMIHTAQRLPFAPSNKIDIIPVDYCARALLHLLTKRQLAHQRYHVSGGPDASCSFQDIDDAYSLAKGEPPATLSSFAPERLASMQHEIARWFGTSEPENLLGAARIYRTFGELDVCFDNTRLLAEGIPRPPRFTEYIDICVKTGEDDPIVAQMTYDFR